MLFEDLVFGDIVICTKSLVVLAYKRAIPLCLQHLVEAAFLFGGAYLDFSTVE